MEYCGNCGIEVPDNANYCSKCGSMLGSGKKEEVYETGRIGLGVSKNAQKSYESSQHELLESIKGGLIILMFGALLFIASSGMSSSITLSNYLAYFLLGIGIILLVSFLIHLRLPKSRLYQYGDIIGGIILFSIGILCIYGFDRYFWSIAIVSVGIYVISMKIVKFLAGKGARA
jgi:hypothetical protein